MDGILKMVVDIAKESDRDIVATTIDKDTPLMTTGLLNSLAIVRIVSAIESRYSIRIPFQAIVKENFDNVRTIEELVVRNGGQLDQPSH